MELIKYKYINIIYTSLAYFIIVFLTASYLQLISYGTDTTVNNSDNIYVKYYY